MVDSLRAALRLLPAVRPSIAGTSGACLRAPKAARIHSTPEHSALLALKIQPQIINCEKAQPGGTGIVRFARAVLAYVGAGLSAVTANQLSGPSILQAKEIVSSTEAGGMWQRTSANRHIVPEDAIRSQKFSHCPLPYIASKSQADGGVHSYHWNNSWGSVDSRYSSDSKLDSQWQLSPSTYRDYRSKVGGLDEGLNSRFSKPTGLQALAAEGNLSLKSSSPGLMSAVTDYNAAAELQLEWQLIVDPKPKSGLGATICDGKEDEGVTFEEAVGSSTKQDESAKFQQVNACEVGTSDIMTKNFKDIMTKTMTLVPQQGSDGVHGVDTPPSASLFHGMSEDQGMGSTSSMKHSLLWPTADKETLAAQNAAEHVENCSLPRRQTRSPSRISLESFDISASIGKEGDMSRSLDKNLLASLLHGNEPTRLENSGLPSSPLLLGRSDPTAAASAYIHRVSQPLSIPSPDARPSTRRGSHSLSADNRNTSWNGGVVSMNADRGSGLLGAALCHSQTRAREAEKKIQEVCEERERLLRLFFREASHSLTYRQWVTSLQAENMWLRMYAPNEPLRWLHRSFVNPFSAMERLSGRHWMNFRQDYARRQMEHNISATHEKDAVDLGASNDIMVGCTLGLAFALGLSLAGAGLMLGWSMGWILLAYSVSM